VDLLGAGVQVVETVQEVYGHGLIFGPTKTYGRRRVPIPRFVIDELAGHQPRPFDPEALVFTGPDGGVLRHRNFYGRHFRPAVALAGLPEHFRFHDYADSRVMPTSSRSCWPTGVKGLKVSA
jgi:integrase